MALTPIRLTLASLDDVAAVGGKVPVPLGGTGVGTLTGLIKGNGAAAFSVAVAGTDYLAPTGDGSGLTGLNASALGSGTIPPARLPALAIVEFLGTVASQAAMLALAGQRGDWCIRSDIGDEFILTTDDPTQAINWKQIVKPYSAVTSVNGQTGAASVGTVTSVGLTVPGVIFTTPVTGSPIIGAGTLALSLLAQAANRLFAGPATGADATPTFRPLAAGDLPSTAVAPGSYTSTNLTVDAQGRITAAASGTGGAVDFQNPARGVYIPKGSLDAWKAARAAAGTTRTEVCILGDSTTIGSTPGGALIYSWVTKLRALSQAAGYADGGRGIASRGDTAGLSGESLSQVQSNTFTDSGSPAGPLWDFSHTSSTAGQAITLQGYGTAVRLLYRISSDSGQWTYAVNGGAAVTVTPGTATPDTGEAVYVSGLAGNPNTVTITNTSGAPLSITAEFLKSTGIAYHKHAAFGLYTRTAGDYTLAVNWVLQLAMGVRPGIAQSSTGYGWGQPAGSRPQYRNCSLVAVMLGMNDIQGAGYAIGNDWQTYLRAMGVIANMIHAGGASGLVLVPHWICAAGPNANEFTANWSGLLRSFALGHGFAVVDLNEVIHPIYSKGPDGTAWFEPTNSHLTQAGYDAIATHIWNNCLSL